MTLLQWGVHTGPAIELLEGYDQGQTQADEPADGEMAVWAHPIDVHYLCRGLSGWPKLHLQVWSLDKHGRADICKPSCTAWRACQLMPLLLAACCWLPLQTISTCYGRSGK
jgi:hypothetical protein